MRTHGNSKAVSPHKTKELHPTSNSRISESVEMPQKPPLRERPAKLATTTPRKDIVTSASSRRNPERADKDDDSRDDEAGVLLLPPVKNDAKAHQRVIKTGSRGALKNPADTSLSSSVRATNDVERRTLPLSNADSTPVTQVDRSNRILKSPTTSTSKQNTRVTIHEPKEAEKTAATIPRSAHKHGQRISASSSSVCNRARRKYSGSIVSEGNDNVGLRQPRQPRVSRKQDSPTHSTSGKNGKMWQWTNIMLNFPDGSSTLQAFPVDAYLDDVRWHVEELLARRLPNCFPFTMARTNPLREFSREDYRRTLEQLKLAPSATLLILPRSTAQGSCGPGTIRPSTSDPNWVLLLKLMFGVFVVSPITLVWGMLNRQRSPINREAMVTRSRNSSSHLALPAPPTRSGSSGGLRKKLSSHTEDFDLF